MDRNQGNLTSRQSVSSAAPCFANQADQIITLVRNVENVRVDAAHNQISSMQPNAMQLSSMDSRAMVTAEQMQSLLNDLRLNQIELERRNEALRRAHRELEESRARYVDLYQSAPVGYCTLNEAGEILDANRTLGVLLGVANEALARKSIYQYICSTNHRVYSEKQQHLLRSGDTQTFELMMVKPDRENFWVSVSAAVGWGNDQEPILRVVITDISDRKESEAALLERDRHLQLIACNMPGPVSRIDRNLRYQFVNPYYERLTGRPPASLVGKSMREVLGDEFFESIQPHIQTALDGKLVTFSAPIKLPNGEVHFAVTTYIPDIDDHGQMLGFFVIGLDTTSNRCTERALATTTELLELTGQLARVGGWELDLRTNGLHWTHEICRIHELDDFITPTLEEAFGYFDPIAQAQLRKVIGQAIEHGHPWDLELPLTTSKGHQIWVRTQGVAVYEDGKAVKLQGALQDITHQKDADEARQLLESQLRESQKMEAIGTLAGGVAHDFNNILAAIMGNADLAIHSLDSPVVTLYCLREICKASERARDLVRQILSFSRPQATERNLISLVEVVEESIRLLRATLPARVALTFECCHKVPRILADTTQIEQVILNLATNAYQALRGQPGCISIKVDTTPLSATLIEAVPRLKPLEGTVDQILRLVVADDGPGMNSEVVARLFEPFFTTKPVGEGTGLGLAVVHGIVRTHQGAITVESYPDQGATFTIYLPVPKDVEQEELRPKHDESEQVVASELNERRALRILYVDDDQAVMQSIGKLLEMRGFLVEGYSDQMEAVEVVRNRSDQFDLVVTDYNMPCLSGLDFARFVKATRADLPVVIISGLIDDELRATAQEVGVSELIAKPFSLKAFCSAVQRAVALPV